MTRPGRSKRAQCGAPARRPFPDPAWKRRSDSFCLGPGSDNLRPPPWSVLARSGSYAGRWAERAHLSCVRVASVQSLSATFLTTSMARIYGKAPYSAWRATARFFSFPFPGLVALFARPTLKFRNKGLGLGLRA